MTVGPYFVMSRERKIDGPFTTVESAVEALFRWVSDPWDYEEDKGGYVGFVQEHELIPLVLHGKVVDDENVRSSGLSLPEGPNVVDWFDPSNPQHVEALRGIQKGNCWPSGLLPSYMSIDRPNYMAYFPKNWLTLLCEKLAKSAREHKVFDNIVNSSDTEDLKHSNSEKEMNSVDGFLIGDLVRVSRDSVLSAGTEGTVTNVNKFKGMLGLKVRGWQSTIFVPERNLVLVEAVSNDSDWELIREEVEAAQAEEEFEPMEVARVAPKRRIFAALRSVAALLLIVGLYAGAIFGYTQLVDATYPPPLVHEIVQNGDEIVATLWDASPYTPFESKAYRTINSLGEVEWYAYPSGTPAANAEELEAAYQSYLIRQEALDVIQENTENGK